MTCASIVFQALAYAGAALFSLLLIVFVVAKRKLSQQVVIEVPMHPGDVNRTKVHVARDGFQFVPFDAKEDRGVPIAEVALRDDEELLLVEGDDVQHLYIAREMAYHHIAQNSMAGEPYMVSF